jgi:hypothetical protein
MTGKNMVRRFAPACSLFRYADPWMHEKRNSLQLRKAGIFSSLSEFLQGGIKREVEGLTPISGPEPCIFKHFWTPAEVYPVLDTGPE